MNKGLVSCAVFAIAVSTLFFAPLTAQETGPSSKHGKSYTPPRTPWGDPDLQGNYTNKYEQSTPLERPDEFVGRRVEDVTGDELARILAKRQQDVLARPAGVGPSQFRDTLDVSKGSRAWLIVDPPDGRIPAMTPEALSRLGPADASLDSGINGIFNMRRRTGSTFGGGPFDGPEDITLWERCITRGLPGAMMPHIIGNSYQVLQSPGFVVVRYELIQTRESFRSTAGRMSPKESPRKWATHAAIGTAIHSSSRPPTSRSGAPIGTPTRPACV